MMNRQTVVNAGHPSAEIVVEPTRNKDANMGVGRAFRRDVSMLPYKAARITRGGMTTPQWRQSAAREINKGVLPPSRAMTVLARSSNSDPGAVGLQSKNWGMVGLQDTPAATTPAPMSSTVKIAAVAGLAFLLYRLTR